MKIFRAYYSSPIGLIEVNADQKGITSLLFTEEKNHEPDQGNKLTSQCLLQLDEYFNLKRKTFDLPLHPAGTPFQQKVWNLLLTIPYGKSISYLNLALKIGDKNSTRAVGSANGKNPVCIVIPCHRVIGNNGRLTGYGGGLWRKKWLLEHEGLLSKSKQTSLF